MAPLLACMYTLCCSDPRQLHNNLFARLTCITKVLRFTPFSNQAASVYGRQIVAAPFFWEIWTLTMFYFNPPLTRNLLAGSSMSRKEKFYEQVNHRRTHTFMPPDEAASGKKSYWPELEITGIHHTLTGAHILLY
jgi:hypothetical protein